MGPKHPESLAEGASAEEIYTAPEIARTRREARLFDDIVSCLERLAKADDLQGIRLYTVWTLTSALHRTLIADIKHNETPTLSRAQLEAARAMLKVLENNPRVLGDRPDAPMKGVRSPAEWAKDWIDKGLAKLG